MNKTIDQHFADWESHTFGFGYGTGEPHTLRSLKLFMDAVGSPNGSHCYDYEALEIALGAPVTWLLINILCRHGTDLIGYGSSPRFGWLTDEGIALCKYLSTKTVAELIDIIYGHEDDSFGCTPTYCNCGPDGYTKTKICHNPFWKEQKPV